MADKLQAKVTEYLKANSKRDGVAVSDNDFIYVVHYFGLPTTPPLLSRNNFTHCLHLGISDVYEQCNVEIDPMGINQLAIDIYDDYKTVIEKSIEVERDFQSRKKRFVPNYKLLLRKYINHVGECEGSTFLSHPSDSLNDVERDFIFNNVIKSV